MTSPNPAPAKGHVEIFRIYDGDYYQVYVDGEHAAHLYKEPWVPFVLSSRQRKKLAQGAGVLESDLRFTFSYPYWHAQEIDMDANDMTYEQMSQWRTSFPTDYDFHVLTLDELETKIETDGL